VITSDGRTNRAGAVRIAVRCSV